MRLYLVRHAHALDADDDGARPLSGRGRADLARIAAFLARTSAFRPTQYWHSPLRRASETARLLALALDPEALLVETDDLAPEDEPELMARRLAVYPADGTVALVGHEPHLSHLAALLLRGRSHPRLIALRKGAIVALERTEHVHHKSGLPRWRQRWHLSPELLEP